jgi:hypothetical protein
MGAIRTMIAAAAFALLGGCGGGSATTAPPGDTTRYAPSADPTTTEATTTKASPPKPKPKPRSATYETAQELCSIVSPREIAKEYGAKANDAFSAAEAYSESYQEWARHDAFEGCLAGFEEEE